MTWARIDDNLTDRPDLLALDRSTRLVHLEAIVWCCRHETDGTVPRHVLRKVTDADDPAAAAETLVAAGLWTETDSGYELVGFLDDQISSEDLARQRDLAAVRQRRQRQHKAGDHTLCDARYCRRAAEAVTRDQHRESRLPDPTRPDPTVREGREGEVGQRGSADATPPAQPERQLEDLAARLVIDEHATGPAKPRKIIGEVF